MMDLGQHGYDYTRMRVESPPPIPCDGCMGGQTASWFIGSFISESLAYVTCALCAVEVSLLVDTCSTCIDDPSDNRECDKCGKGYRRAPKVMADPLPPELEPDPSPTPEPTPELVEATA